MRDSLIYIAIPGIVIGFAMIIGGLSVAYLAIRAFLRLIAPSKSHLAGLYFGYFWIASVVAIIGYLISEFGYHLNFWEAPGIWGQPGKDATAWGALQYILPVAGFALGIAVNAILEHRLPGKAPAMRIGIAVLGSLLLIVTLILSAWHGMQTMG